MNNIKNNNFLAISIGIVYLWFGALKFFPYRSPAEDLAKNTIQVLTFDIIPTHISIILLAILEVSIGLLFLLNIFTKQAIIIALCHITLTFLPLFFFPEMSFSTAPLIPTLLGQYIGKNIIIAAALLSLFKNRKLA